VKRLFTAIIILLALLLIAAVVLYSWTFTPYGRLDFDVAILLKLIPNSADLPIEEEREKFRQGTELVSREPPPVERAEDRNVPGPGGPIPIRIYWPATEPELPILLYFHGGAFRFGDLNTHDRICRSLAHKAQALVVSVDYRLAPEHPFPAAVKDCFTALQWVSENARSLGADSDRIAVGGDSAGGNLAAVTTLKSRDLSGPRIVFQLLIYPRTNMATYDTDSWAFFKEGYLLTREMSEKSQLLYLPDPGDRTNPYASPILAANHTDLPPALVITAEFDPLRDDGEGYARKLREAGVPAEVIRYQGMIHGFFNIPVFRKTEGALNEAAEALRLAFETN
jgi:acetyl esterase